MSLCLIEYHVMKMYGKMRYRSTCSAPRYQIEVSRGWVSCHNCFTVGTICLVYCVKGCQITKEQYSVSCDKFEAVDLLREIKKTKLSLMLAPGTARTSLPLFLYKVTTKMWRLYLSHVYVCGLVSYLNHVTDFHLQLLGNSNLHPKRPTTTSTLVWK